MTFIRGGDPNGQSLVYRRPLCRYSMAFFSVKNEISNGAKGAKAYKVPRLLPDWRAVGLLVSTWRCNRGYMAL